VLCSAPSLTLMLASCACVACLPVLTFLHGLLCAVSHPSKAEQASDAVSLPAFLTSHGFTHVAWLRDGVSKWRAALAQLVASNPGDTSSNNVPLMTFHLVDASQDTAATPSECAGFVATAYVAVCVNHERKGERALCHGSDAFCFVCVCVCVLFCFCFCRVKLLQRAAECVSGVDACPEILYPAWLACGLVLPLAPQTKKRRRKNKKSKKSKKQNEPAFHDPLTRVIEDTVAGLNTLMNQVCCFVTPCLPFLRFVRSTALTVCVAWCGVDQASNDRSVLQLQEDVRKPKAITTYDPLFEDGYQPSANPMPTDPKAQVRVVTYCAAPWRRGDNTKCRVAVVPCVLFLLPRSCGSCNAKFAVNRRVWRASCARMLSLWRGYVFAE